MAEAKRDVEGVTRVGIACAIILVVAALGLSWLLSDFTGWLLLLFPLCFVPALVLVLEVADWSVWLLISRRNGGTLEQHDDNFDKLMDWWMAQEGPLAIQIMTTTATFIAVSLVALAMAVGIHILIF